jgi:hypothetical protein
LLVDLWMKMIRFGIGLMLLAAVAAQTGPNRLWDLVRRDSRFGAPGHEITLGEQRYLGEAGVFDVTFGFSLAQQQRVLDIAMETGLRGCIEDTNRYVRQGTLPPDIFSGGPVVQCDRIFQDFARQVAARRQSLKR